MFTIPSPFTEDRPEEYVAFDLQGRYTWVSERTARRLGRTRESMIGRHLSELFPESSEFRRMLEHVAATRESVDLELDSTVLKARLQVRAYSTNDGVEVYYSAVGDDTRTRQDAARMVALITLLNSAQDYDEVIASVLDFLSSGAYGVLIALRGEDDGALSLAHRRGYEGSPVREQRGLSAPMSALLGEVVRSRRLTVLSRAEALARHPGLVLADATQELVAVPLMVAGRVLGVLLLSLSEPTTIDVLEHSRLTVLAGQCAVAIDRTRLYAQAQQDRARFRILLESTAAIILELDADLHVRRPMPTWEAFTGQTFDEYRGRGFLAAVHPEHRADLEGLLTSDQVIPHPVELVGRIRSAAGVYRDVVSHVVPILNADGRVDSWMGTVRDVTEARRRERWARRTRDFMLAVGSAPSAQDTFDRALDGVAGLMRADRGVLMAVVRPGDPMSLLAARGVPGDDLPALRATVLSLDPRSAASDGGDARWVGPDPAKITLPGLPVADHEEVVIVPLTLDRTFVGQLVLVGRQGERPDADVLAYLATLQPQVAQTVQRAQLQAALERREAEAQAILATLEEAIFLLDEHGQVVAANDALFRLTGITPPVLHLGDLIARSGPLLDGVGHPVHPGEHPAERALRSGDGVRGEIVQHTLSGGRPQWLSVTALPVRRDGQHAGLVVSMADVTDSVLIERQLEALALEDDLTGLPNRRSLMRTLDRLARDPERPRSLLLVDIDGFKVINEGYGYVQGDRLLRTAAQRLRSAAAGALLARLGGDEFCVLLPDADAGRAAAVAADVLGAFRLPCQLDGTAVQVTVSVGLAVGGPGGVGAGDLYRNASLALIDARAQGGNRVCEYADHLGAAHVRRTVVERRLRLALAHRELHVAYQPIVDLTDPAFVGFEALARWQDHELGFVSPAEFIPVAESSGLIHELGLQVLAGALDQCVRWTREWGRRVHMSVNVSASQFMRPAFLSTLLDLLTTSAVQPGQLTLEVTEAVAIHSLDDVIAQLRSIREAGVRIALDDFGTGFSSLAVLERLPIDTLKLDRALVAGVHRSPRRLDLLRAVIMIAQRLSLTIVAEGVEELQELELLRDAGCGRVQGYYFSRPRPAGEFTPPDGGAPRGTDAPLRP